MNIVGEAFPEEIKNQVAVRQLIYGSGYVNSFPRTSEHISYLNANTSWCKLVSSVDISDPTSVQNETINKLNNIPNNSLAKKFVLFNGVNETPSNQRAGIDLTGDILGNNNAYGIGGTEFGLRPMMGIKSAEIKHENRGSIRRATVQIKAWNKQQFDIIDTLYLRLGFSVLLEWGHTMWYDNDGVLHTGSDIDKSLASAFLTGGVSYGSFLKLIQNNRLSSNGNYDAMFGKVCNFHWSFQKDGSYDITLDLVSVGDVIESFKINVLTQGPKNDIGFATGSKSLDQLNDRQIVALFANQHTIGQWFNDLAGNLNSIEVAQEIKEELEAATTKFAARDNTQTSQPQIFDNLILPNKNRLYVQTYFKKLQPQNTQNTQNTPPPNQSNNPNVTSKDAITIKYKGQSSNFWYVRLGSLLDFIRDNVLYVINKGKGTNARIINIDTTVKDNLMYVDSLQISADPNICVVNRTLNIEGVDYNFTNYLGQQAAEFVQDKVYGQIMNVYVHMKWVLIKLNELKDITNKVVLIDFLNDLLGSISSALGGVNNLEATIDDETNTIVIRDQNPLPNSKQLLKDNNRPTDYTNFDLYKYTKTDITIEEKSDPITLSHASFIKDFSFTTELSPATSTMLTVGATANSTVVGENSTAFSRFNTGLTDRYKETISLPGSKAGGSIDKTTDELTVLKDRYASAYTNFLIYIQNISDKGDFTYNEGEGDVYKDALYNYITLKNQISAAKKTTGFLPHSGFIPFNLSLTMDGLSGMKIYSKFFIDTEFLPSNYPKNAEFLIKSVTHKIENNKWNTTLESLITIDGSEEKVEPTKLYDKILSKVNPSQNPSVQKSLAPFDDYLDPTKFVYPTTTNAGSPIGNRTNPFKPLETEFHNGYDLGGVIGDDIVSACDGTVIQVGGDGYGPHALFVKVDKSCYKDPRLQKDIYIWYGHNSANIVSSGIIEKGKLIAKVGSEGQSTDPHLHFEIYVTSPGSYAKEIILDPKKYFGNRGTSLTAGEPFTVKTV